MLIEMHSPFRDLDWRWRRAQRLTSRPTIDPDAMNAEDEWIRLAASMCHANVNGHDSPSSHGVAASVAAAFELHRAGGLECAVLQARLLAGESDEAIAAKSGIAPETVAAYEALHFNVRDRLAGRDWIVSRVLGLYPRTAEPRAEKTNLIRRYGYFGGPLLVDLWTAYFTGASLAEFGPDADVRAALDLLVKIWSEPVTDVAATLRGFSEYEKLLKRLRSRTANAAETPNNPLPLDLAAAISSDFRVELDFNEPAQTQEASTDAA